MVLPDLRCLQLLIIDMIIKVAVNGKGYRRRLSKYIGVLFCF